MLVTAFMLCLVLVPCILSAAEAGTDSVDDPGVRQESLDQSATRLLAVYDKSFRLQDGVKERLPFDVSASDAGDTIRSHTYFFLADINFDEFVDVLGKSSGWCDSLLLHLNVKGCVYFNEENPRLVLYLGRKYYQTPSESVGITFRFHHQRQAEVMRTTLKADKGPYGTSDYNFVVNAVNVDNGVFVELRFENSKGYAGQLVDLYLNTLGRSKIGFTVVGESLFGNPMYVHGTIGAAERNVVRYMFALRVSLEHRNEPFEKRAEAWFDATERYADQLHEYSRERYLDIKAKEHANQVKYQQAAERGESVEIPVKRRNR
ncbi:MAG: hypothetical protein DHS20C01_21500 [marine bacterium B5-7]|nr:MAG: hypothetical protein DHS20C01_21500 [marine bacterium B5-7]